MDPVIQAIAARAQVSPSTAYRILSGRTKGCRRDAARRAEIVMQAARELGYRPNQAARGLVMQRSFCIGFIGSEMDNPVRSRLVEKLRGLCQERQFNFLAAGTNDRDDMERAVDAMAAHRVDGLIIAHGHDFPFGRLLRLISGGVPVVSFGQGCGLGWDHVEIDYARMVCDLTAHLIRQHGRTGIAFAGLPWEYPRYAGFLAAWRDWGRGGEPERWETVRYGMADGCLLARKMIAAGSRPDALVCHNDLLALGIMAGLRELGIRVPEDVAVVGLDNIGVASFFNPSLTTAGVDSSALARTLARLLFDRLAGDGAPSPIDLECPGQLVFRESCGCNSFTPV